MFEELNSLLDSPTIKPTFEKVHIILALFIFAEHREGIGRYRLHRELLIGEGTAKSLIKKLNEDVNFITVTNDVKRRGHSLTKEGREYLKKVKQRIPIIKKCNSSQLQGIIIETEKSYTFFTLIRNGSDKITNGISQRDAAIKVNGSGATCLVYNGKNLIFPSKDPNMKLHKEMIVNKKIYRHFESIISKENIILEKNDVIAIGSGDTLQKARIATLNAALTLL